MLVANKAEGKHGEVGAMESYALGLGDPIQISAEHGEGMSDLYDALRVLMPSRVRWTIPSTVSQAWNRSGDRSIHRCAMRWSM